MLISNEPSLSWSSLVASGKVAKLPAYLNHRSTRYVFLARNALYHGLWLLGIQPGQKILVPAYHCAAMVEPIRAFGAELIFYRINTDCSPDFKDLETKLDVHTKAVISIHYFGFPAPIGEFQAFCAAHELFLIEDCAHVFIDDSARNTLGTHGHISIFSFRKFLPVYDGGCLVINKKLSQDGLRLRKEDLAFSSKVTKNLLEKLIGNPSTTLTRHLRSGLAGLYRGVRNIFPRSVVKSKVLTFSVTSSEFDLSLVDLPMSRLSQHILHNADFDNIVKKRRSNYTYLLNATTGLPGFAPLHPDLPHNLCPWVFPAFSTQVKDLHKRLRERGIAAFAWDAVIHPSLPLAQFPDAAYLYANLICLPIHQDLMNRELDMMVSILKDVLKEDAPLSLTCIK